MILVNSNQHGNTLVEVLMASLIMVVGFFAVTANFVNMAKLNKRSQQVNEHQESVYSYIDSIKVDGTSMQKNFAPTSTQDSVILDPANLTIGVQQTYVGPKSGCVPDANSCDAYVGYTLRPESGYPGLFRGTMMIYMPQRDPQGAPILSNGTVLTDLVETGNFIMNSN